MANKTKTKEEPKMISVRADSLKAMADNVEIIARAGRDISHSRLGKRAVLLLLGDMTGLSMTAIERVLNALPQLEKTYLK